MKLSAWARQQGISYKTAWRWWKAGLLPVKAEQMPSGTVIVIDGAPPHAGAVGLYARVSTPDQKDALDAQLGRLAAYANAQKWPVAMAVAEVGSGLDGHRPKLMRLLADAAVTTIVVEHRDRLMLFGVEYVESALAAQGRRLVAINPTAAAKDDLALGMAEALTSLCARQYGRQAARDKAQKALAAIHE